MKRQQWPTIIYTRVETKDTGLEDEEQMVVVGTMHTRDTMDPLSKKVTVKENQMQAPTPPQLQDQGYQTGMNKDNLNASSVATMGT